MKRHKRKLDKMVEEKQLLSYLPYGSEDKDVMVKMVLPLMKPDLKSDESLSNIGAIADLLGIPGVSKLIDLYVTGKDLKSTLEEDEKGVNYGSDGTGRILLVGVFAREGI